MTTTLAALFHPGLHVTFVRFGHPLLFLFMAGVIFLLLAAVITLVILHFGKK